MARLPSHALGLAFALALTGCPSEGATLVVNVRTDLSAVGEFNAIRTELVGGRSEDQIADRSADWFSGVRVAEFSALDHGSVTVRVSLVGAEGVVAERTQLVEVRGPISTTILVTRDCRDVVCAAEETCVGGRCAGLTCSEGELSACPSDECATDADCGPSAECAASSCVGGSCVFRLDESLCGPSEFCEPEAGCTTVFDGDAGAPADAGGCPSTYMTLGRSCYRFETRPATWLAAEAECESEGGHLAVVADVDEHFVVHDLTVALDQVWIGYQDLALEGTFRWVAPGGLDPLDVGCLWGDTAPMNDPTLDCVTQGLNLCGDWYLRSCDDTLPFVCEIDGATADPSTYTP